MALWLPLAFRVSFALAECDSLWIEVLVAWRVSFNLNCCRACAAGLWSDVRLVKYR